MSYSRMFAVIPPGVQIKGDSFVCVFVYISSKILCNGRLFLSEAEKNISTTRRPSFQFLPTSVCIHRMLAVVSSRASIADENTGPEGSSLSYVRLVGLNKAKMSPYLLGACWRAFAGVSKHGKRRSSFLLEFAGCLFSTLLLLTLYILCRRKVPSQQHLVEYCCFSS